MSHRFTAHLGDEPVGDDQPYARPLLQLGDEQPVPRQGCWAGDCTEPEESPVDLYCAKHERVIPGSRINVGPRTRTFILNLLRFAICGAVLLAAGIGTSIPLFALFVVAGIAVGAGSLHRFPMTVKVVIGAWLLACLVAALLPLLSPGVESILRAVLAGLVLVLAVIHAGAFAWATQGSYGGAAAITVGAFATVPAMAMGWVLTHPSVGFTTVPSWVRHWLLIAMVTGVVGAMLVAAIAGAVLGQSKVNTEVRAPLSARPAPWVVHWKTSAPRRSKRNPWEQALLKFEARAKYVVVAMVRGIANLLLRAAHIVQVFVVRLINWVHRQMVIAVRRLKAAVVGTFGVIGRAVVLGLTVAGRTSQVIVLPALAVAAGAAGVVFGSDYALRYLRGEGLDVLGPLAIAVAGGFVALTLLWMALSGLPFSESRDSWLRSALLAAPQLIVMFTLGGWVVGLPGLFGPGPITVGPVTITSTALLVAVFAWARWSGDDGEEQDETPPAATVRPGSS
ncbi:hypothetical protein AB0E63_42735 [Kribbella sp. NPDC026596]|uniref:hypothetical protein n=1 Tax=Kribbella sp. NPDC026596 TaxID=3155122 RepID=UPI00340F39F4